MSVVLERDDTQMQLEEKSWIAKVEQAKLYSERAQVALDTVKVSNTISPTSEKRWIN